MMVDGPKPSGSTTAMAGFSLAVLSLSSDPGPLALGPQLAVFAASLGIPTTLVIGPQQDATPRPRFAPRAPCAVRIVETAEPIAGHRLR